MVLSSCLGSGKTSLLDVVACRCGGTVQGHVTYGGQPLTESVFRKRAGYVVQTDHVMSQLTVRESLTYTAQLKYIGQDVDRAKQVNTSVM